MDLPGPQDEPGRAERARDLLSRLAAEPFDLAAGPLVRVLLVRLGPTRWMLGLAAHHIVLDGWSLGLLLRRLAQSSRRMTRGGTPPPPAADRPPAPRPRLRRGRRRVLAGPDRYGAAGGAAHRPPGPRPADLARGAVPVRVDAALAGRLRTLAAEHGATPFMALMAAFGVLLGRWSGQDDLVVGTVVSGRAAARTPNTSGCWPTPCRSASTCAPPTAHPRPPRRTSRPSSAGCAPPAWPSTATPAPRSTTSSARSAGSPTAAGPPSYGRCWCCRTSPSSPGRAAGVRRALRTAVTGRPVRAVGAPEPEPGRLPGGPCGVRRRPLRRGDRGQLDGRPAEPAGGAARPARGPRHRPAAAHARPDRGARAHRLHRRSRRPRPGNRAPPPAPGRPCLPRRPGGRLGRGHAHLPRPDDARAPAGAPG
ncbi:condensation domain-containing protein [Streptomyces tricolor]|nr:condensation domain-containing protein [Streptomyces tricolor]